MYRRAFFWRSGYLISNLTLLAGTGHLPAFQNVTANPDRKLLKFLRTVVEDSRKLTVGGWLMTFHPCKGHDELASHLRTFLDNASGDSVYRFDNKIASIFLDLLVSSLYAYLCLMKLVHGYINVNTPEELPKFVGKFSNAVRGLYYVTHSYAMKAYFTHVQHPILNISVSRRDSDFAESIVESSISHIYGNQGWK